jgi:hypothetical protein
MFEIKQEHMKRIAKIFSESEDEEDKEEQKKPPAPK